MILPHAPGLTSLKMHDDGYHEVNLSKGVFEIKKKKGERKRKKMLLVFQITLRINQDCLNVKAASGCM